MKYPILILFMNFLPQYAGKSLSRDGNYSKAFEDIKKEIAGYSSIAKDIIDLAVYGKAQNRSYERLAVFADTIGPRLSGSKNLDAAIKYMFRALQEDGLENVHLEPVKVPHWERGEEFAMMLEPRTHSIAILGLGNSIATAPEGVTAEVIVVASFDELRRRAPEAKGKIVVYNQPFITYWQSVQYRSRGAVEAAKVGAVASLIRSAASLSIRSPHTGWQNYQPGVPAIPTACISVEDAEMMSRMSLRGTKIVVYLKLGAKTYPDATSFNTVAEIVGSKFPEQIVLVSGHLDSWDVGQGAMDDGGGAFISWEALSLVKDLGLRPKRTLRLVLWTGEEQGGIGAEQYYQLHKENISNFDIVMESDEGTFKPMGLAFTGTSEARDIVREIMTLLLPVNITDIYDPAEGTDIDHWMRAGVPEVEKNEDGDQKIEQDGIKPEDKAHKAATKIQASFRGHITRKKLKGEKKGDAPASETETADKKEEGPAGGAAENQESEAPAATDAVAADSAQAEEGSKDSSVPAEEKKGDGAADTGSEQPAPQAATPAASSEEKSAAAAAETESATKASTDNSPSLKADEAQDKEEPKQADVPAADTTATTTPAAEDATAKATAQPQMETVESSQTEEKTDAVEETKPTESAQQEEVKEEESKADQENA